MRISECYLAFPPYFILYVLNNTHTLPPSLPPLKVQNIPGTNAFFGIVKQTDDSDDDRICVCSKVRHTHTHTQYGSCDIIHTLHLLFPALILITRYVKIVMMMHQEVAIVHVCVRRTAKHHTSE